jgi:hypothetical protein
MTEGIQIKTGQRRGDREKNWHHILGKQMCHNDVPGAEFGRDGKSEQNANLPQKSREWQNKQVSLDIQRIRPG